MLCWLAQAATARAHRWRLIDSATRYTSWAVRLSPIEAPCALFITEIRLGNCFHRRRPIFTAQIIQLELTLRALRANRMPIRTLSPLAA